MMARHNVEFIAHVGVAWWLRPAIACLVAWAYVTRKIPSDALIRRIVSRAVTTRLVEKRAR